MQTEISKVKGEHPEHLNTLLYKLTHTRVCILEKGCSPVHLFTLHTRMACGAINDVDSRMPAKPARRKGAGLKTR